MQRKFKERVVNKTMKKKILTLTSCMVLAAGILTGCMENYPTIYIDPSAFGTQLNIDIGEKYKFDRYERSDTNSGCIVNIYFKKVKTN